VKQSEFLRCVESWTERNEGVAEEWAREVTKTPLRSLECARTGVEAIVFADIGNHFRHVVRQQRMSDGEALDYANRRLLDVAKHVPASTGLLDAELRQYTACAWAKIIDYGQMALVRVECEQCRSK